MSDRTRGTAIDPQTVEAHTGSSYPAPFDADCIRREKRRLGDAFGLTQFGVNLTHLWPGQMSAQRHWHSREDEFAMMLEGEAVLVTDAGEQVVRPGMVMGFPAGAANGHHLVNRSDSVAVYLEVGTRDAMDECDYPDIDMLVRIVDGRDRFVHKDGTPYDE
jgi:uncharacterized cupin superfamily protein